MKKTIALVLTLVLALGIFAGCGAKEDKVITGYGFESDQNLSEYQIKNTTGIFTVEDKSPQPTGDIQTDSIKTAK